MDCEHRFIYKGMVYEVSEYNKPGTGARDVEYFEHYFCEKCLEVRYFSIGCHSNTYEVIRFDAVPRKEKG